METKELIEKGTAHVVKMLDGTDGERWNGDNPMYAGMCGWCGVMSPMNRPAFVAKFGEAFTNVVEKRARAALALRADFWEKSKAKQYEIEANTFEGIKDPGFLEVGSFVWAVGDGLKCDHGDLTRCIRYHLEDEKEGKPRTPELCKIVRIEEVDDLLAVAKDFLKTWKPQANEGGAASDDVTDEEAGEGFRNYSRLTKEQKRTFYTLCVLVRDKSTVTPRRYFLIDPEGYDYPRYVLLPKDWKTVLEPIATAEKEAMEAEEAAAKAAKEQAKAERKAAYDARCAKWESIMEPVPAGDKWNKDYRKVGKRNIAAMAKKAFPWVRFSVSYDKGWGCGYTLKWKNGPTKEEVKAACDFGLFSLGRDTFCGYDDSTGYESAEFSEFARKFGGVDNGVDLEREECDHDQNGDPNGKPPKVSKPKAEGAAANAVTVTENTEKNGVEIRFSAIPSEEVRTELKSNGWRWTRFGGCWYNRMTTANMEYARSLAERLNGRAAA